MFDEKVEAPVARVCQQRGILSALLWNVVVDDLISKLNESGTQCYEDDIVIVLRGKFASTQRALKMVLH